MSENILVTGGAGFIGSHLIRFLINNYPNYNVFNLDLITYAGNLKNLVDIESKPNYKFIKEDICDFPKVKKIFQKYNINKVIHLAAESHVDNSIKSPFQFANTNVLGTLSLLEAAKESWSNNYENKLFYHISTDEVYGSLDDYGFFFETSKYDPRSPYAASKASSDHFVKSYAYTFSLPVILSNSSNNYGPNQNKEKLIPLVIKNIISKKTIPLYGKGENIRDWLYVEDHIDAIDKIFHKGKLNNSYNIGGSNEWKNIDLVKLIIKIVDKYMGRIEGCSNYLINFVDDRPGHDYRYAINFEKLKKETNWVPSTNFQDGILNTVKWYIDNQSFFKKN